MITRLSILTLLGCCLLPLNAAQAAPDVSSSIADDMALAEGLSASGAWIRETPPNRRMAAGYLTLANATAAPIVVTGAESASARVEIHTMRTVDGMMRMRRLEHLAVPSHGVVELAPGGTHLMLFDADASRAGTKIELALITDDNRRLPLIVEVRKTAPKED